MVSRAETYLRRADAYLGRGERMNASSDISEVRRRSNAGPGLPDDVDIDYIQDERMRELGIEEKRKLTLMRLGLLYDRVSRFNPYYDDVTPTYKLWPIPFSEIETNKEAILEQKPGYDQ